MFPDSWRASIESAPRSTVGSLIGDQFFSSVRILHPATSEDGTDTTWSWVAKSRNVAFNPSTSSWCDIAGVSLGQDTVIAGKRVTAPVGGLGDRMMQRLLHRMSKPAHSTLVGYVEHRGPAMFEGKGYLGTVILRGIRFGV